MRRTFFRLLAILFVVSVAAAACGDSDDASSSAGGEEGTTDSTETGATETTGDDAAAAPAASGDPIILGAVMPLSGASASTGILARQGAELAVEQINASGGVLGRPLELAFKDSLGSPEEAVKIVREYDSEGIDFTWGYTTSSGCLAVAPVAEELDMLMLSNYCQTNKMNGEEFTESGMNPDT